MKIAVTGYSFIDAIVTVEGDGDSSDEVANAFIKVTEILADKVEKKEETTNGPS